MAFSCYFISIPTFPLLWKSDSLTSLMSAIRNVSASCAKVAAALATDCESVVLNDPTATVSLVVTARWSFRSEKCVENVWILIEGDLTKDARFPERCWTLRVMLKSPRTLAVFSTRLAIGVENTRVEERRRGKREVKICILKVLFEECRELRIILKSA